MFNWVKVVTEPMKVAELEDDCNDDWMEEVMRKEERLSRMAERRKQWEAGFVCKGVLEEVMEKVARCEIEKDMEKVVEEVVDSVLKESRIRKLMSVIEEFSLENIIIIIEIQKRKEGEDAAVRIMLEEEEKDEWLEKKKWKALALRRRYDWLEEDRLAEILARMEIACVMDVQMKDVEESKTMEMDVLEDEMVHACTMDNHMEDVEECKTRELDNDMMGNNLMDMEGEVVDDSLGKVTIQENCHELEENDECIITIHFTGGCIND